MNSNENPVDAVSAAVKRPLLAKLRRNGTKLGHDLSAEPELWTPYKGPGYRLVVPCKNCGERYAMYAGTFSHNLGGRYYEPKPCPKSHADHRKRRNVQRPRNTRRQAGVDSSQ